MKIAMLSPIAPRTPHRHYGPRENIISLLTEGLIKRGIDVTLFAAGDSENRGRLVSVCPGNHEEDPSILSGIRKCLHISQLFEQANHFDLVHNNFGCLPLTYAAMTTTPVVTTIHGSPSEQILPVYKKYNGRTRYVAISEADRSSELDYIATIHHGIDLGLFTFQPKRGEYLLSCGHIHPDKGTKECIEVAKQTGMKLIIAGIVQDRDYFERFVQPHLDDSRIVYMGNVGPDRFNELLGGARALLHPVNFDEPFELSTVEAMACGTPVIAVNRGSMPEIIQDGVSGFLVRDTAEMAEKIGDVGRLDRRNCRSWVEQRFSVDRMIDDYITVYERVITLNRRDDHRPWGFFEILSEGPEHKVKRITVHPEERLSYQRHARRSEHWFIVNGAAVITINGKDMTVSAGDSVDIPVGAWHRISNRGPLDLVFIEVQRGDYFGEDDIERSEDDYGRVEGPGYQTLEGNPRVHET
ncbi:MAG: mannose-6-phosphate isomerase [delta proteobacterium MLS_D]|jgi:glycosyltransferase involved in cell wall biosynthesis/mannose-6-phosphate isomerase-like protein (cupin superfamily)|nr:MAG: mannose-6-phosphate isomerase [delta proteobacterium MLS_D]